MMLSGSLSQQNSQEHESAPDDALEQGKHHAQNLTIVGFPPPPIDVKMDWAGILEL